MLRSAFDREKDPDVRRVIVVRVASARTPLAWIG